MGPEKHNQLRSGESCLLSPFIGGRESQSHGEQVLDIVSPSCGQRIWTISAGTEDDVDRAVASCRSAFEDGRWCDLPPSSKKRVLHRFADLIDAEAPKLDALDAQEMGKPISVQFGNAGAAATLVRFHAEAVDKTSADVFTSDKTSWITQHRLPRGVIGAIVPWNFPTINAAIKVAPALAAGNAVVLKPSELGSSTSICLARLAIEAGVPPGVFNVVPGLGTTVGRALALHGGVDMLAFTGSTAVGKLMHQYAGQSNLKHVLSECGGKSPHVVFADGVDLDAAADGVAYSILTNQGQWCAAGSRLLVQQEIESTLVEKLMKRFSSIVVGDPLDATVTYGPLVTAQHYARVRDYVALGHSEAEWVMGGQPLLESTGGYFLTPALFREVRADTRIAQEEIFGPVLSITSFRDEAEAISLANSTVYGLVATVWTARLATGMRLSREIRSGLVTVNAGAPRGEGSQAFSVEPYGQSGQGTELGLAGMESYSRRQLVWLNQG